MNDVIRDWEITGLLLVVTFLVHWCIALGQEIKMLRKDTMYSIDEVRRGR